MIKKINQCRICGNKDFIDVLDLGTQFLTSVFPDRKQINNIERYPLKLIKCHGNENVCNLVQLAHSVEKNLMYSDNYGYRSGLNSSMMLHLQNRVKQVMKIVNFKKNDIVLDIGSNDGTTLSYYDQQIKKIGIDPTSGKFKEFYKPDITVITDFFSAEVLKNYIGNKKIKAITSFAMFYDLEKPVEFADQIAQILDINEGIWVLEQSYLPEMLNKLSFDTICHEHLEYYSLTQIDWIMSKVGLKIINVEFNEINGGSFAVTVCHKSNKNYKTSKIVNKILQLEIKKGLLNKKIFKLFSKKVNFFKNNFKNFLTSSMKSGKKIFGIGASTKGNVILQYCEIDKNLLPYIGEINPEKFNKFTPGSWIEIKQEDEILKMNPDLLLILPWHFKTFFLEQKKYKKFNLLFPLPETHIVKSNE